MKSVLVILCFAVVALEVVFNENRENQNNFTCDKCGYYLYLPALFINHDLRNLAFFDTLDAKMSYRLALSPSLHQVNGHRLNKYPVGVALLQLPFFLVANSWANFNTHIQPSGFSQPYQLSLIFGILCYVTCGLFVLRRLLLRFFSDTVTAITILCIAFGTNLYTYTTFDLGMSHPYSFFLFCCLLSLSYQPFIARSLNFRVAFVTGLFTGLIFIVRPVNIIAAIVPVFVYVQVSIANRKQQHHFRQLVASFCAAVLGFVIIASLQFAYWHYITGHWFYYAYQGEHFYFFHPHIIEGLFSFRKGWFLYTPMALLAFLGFFTLWKHNRQIALVLLAFFTIMIYVVFSWREWWYGGSFGCRAMIETYAFLSLPLASLIEKLWNDKRRFSKPFLISVLVLFCGLNMFQSFQYSIGLLYWDRITPSYYMKIFGRTDRKNEQYLQYLEKEDTAWQ